MNAPPNAPLDVYLAFSDNITQATVQRLIQALMTAANNGVTHVHLFFHSSGGGSGDGVALHNFLRALPMELTIYNAGNVASAAAIAFLGAKNRKASASAVFMLHRVTNLPLQPAQSGTLQALAESVAIDDARTDALIRSRAKLPNEVWAKLDKYDAFITAKEALAYGIVDEIREFSPPPGSRIFNV